MKQPISFEKAKSRMMNYCSKSERCCAEVRDKLYKLEQSKEDIEKIISELINNRYIDERRYARAFARDKTNISRWGLIRIERELKLKKIPQEYIKVVLDEIRQEVNADDTLLELLKAKKRLYPNSLDNRRIYERLLRFALYRGYEYNTIKNTIRKIIKIDECEDY